MLFVALVRQFGGSKKLVVISLLVISAVVLITFFPSIKVGFLGDDWDDTARAARMPFADYMRSYLDPTLQWRFYRPVYGALIFVEDHLFGANPEGYHIVQIAVHLTNCLLLYGVIVRLTRRSRIALLSSIWYATLPVYSSAIFWVAVPDPLAMVFNLGAIMLWVIYLQTKKKPVSLLAFVMTILALAAKESNVFLPVTLFLIDRWFIADPSDLKSLVKRYSPFGIALIVYAFIEHLVQTRSYFTNVWGYGIGVQMIENALHYLALLVVPWGVDQPINYVVLAVVLVVLIRLAVVRRSRWLLFLGIETTLAILPVIGFPTIFFYARYLYAAAMVSGILLALLLDVVWKKLDLQRQRGFAISLLAILLLWSNSALTGQVADATAEEGRQARVPFRDISQQHPSFPSGTYLYFIEPPYPMILRNLSGMFYLRYGPAVSVWSTDAEFGGPDQDRFAQLRAHSNSFVYYFDESKQRHKIAVDPVDTSSAMPALPVRFQSSVGLEGYEITSSCVKSGEDLGLLLYWQASAPIVRDDTVFVHLIDANGETVFGEDSPPRGGRAPTSAWKPGKLVVDAHILKMTQIPPGKYRLALGMYDLSTQTSLAIIDENGGPMSQQLIIGPIEVVE